MAGPVAWHLQGGPHSTIGVQQGRGVAVAVGVDSEGRRRPGPRAWAWRLLGPDGDRWLAPAWIGVTTPRQDCEGSRQTADRLLIRPVPAAPGQISRKAHLQGGQRGLGSLSLPASACQHPDQAPPAASQRRLLRARYRRTRVARRPGLPAPGGPTRPANAAIAGSAHGCGRPRPGGGPAPAAGRLRLRRGPADRRPRRRPGPGRRRGGHRRG
jgi:hypothetical protein